jgi:hypothetical protein
MNCNQSDAPGKQKKQEWTEVLATPQNFPQLTWVDSW